MGVNICIAPQQCKCRCVCYVVSERWVCTVISIDCNINQVIPLNPLIVPQSVLGVQVNLCSSGSSFVLTDGIAHLLKAHPLSPSSWLLICSLTCLWADIVQNVCVLELVAWCVSLLCSCFVCKEDLFWVSFKCMVGLYQAFYTGKMNKGLYFILELFEWPLLG